MNIGYLVKNYDKRRMPYECRGQKYDTLRKREGRKKDLKLICEDLFFECEQYKRLRLTLYQKERVIHLTDTFSNDFKSLHIKAKSETIILAFIFYIKMNEDPKIKLNQYKITAKYGLNNNIFEIILCRLCEYYMNRMPLSLVNVTKYDHEILSCNGGNI